MIKIIKSKEYIRKLEKKFQEYFDIKDPPDHFPLEIDIYAAFHQKNEKYFGSKKINLWRITTNEHIFLKCYDNLHLHEVDTMVNALKTIIDELIVPSTEHMKTYLTGIFLVENNNLPSALVSYIENFRYSKVFKFYLHGWCDLRLILIDLSSGKIVTNREGREVANFYLNLLED